MKVENLKLNNIEIRARAIADHKREVVKHDKDLDGREFCCVIAWIKEGCEEPWVETVGMRPWENLTEDELETFNKLIKMWYELTNAQ